MQAPSDQEALLNSQGIYKGRGSSLSERKYSRSSSFFKEESEPIIQDDDTKKDVELSVLRRNRLASDTPQYYGHHDHVKPLLGDYANHESVIRRDFTTIDWSFNKYLSKKIDQDTRRANLLHGPRSGYLRNKFRDAQGWIILLIIGVFTAQTTDILFITTSWLSDLKMGFCDGHFWATRDICCIVVTEENKCRDWISWGQFMFGVAYADKHTTLTYIANYAVYVLFSVLFATLSAWFVFTYARMVFSSGLPEIKTVLGGFIIKGLLGIRVLFFKSITIVLAVASGLSIGKLAPLIHIACCYGNIAARQFDKFKQSEVKKREIISAAVAAGVSAAFGAPIGGVLYSLEAMSYYFPAATMWRAFFCAVTTALMLQYLDPFSTGALVQFEIVTTHDWSWFEFIPFAILGALGGLLGSAFIKLNLKVQAFRKQNDRIRRHPIFEVVILALLTALFSYPNPYTRGSSIELLGELLNECTTLEENTTDSEVTQHLCHSDNNHFSIVLLLLAGVMKLVFTVFTFGAKIPAGLFIPSLCAGACLGRSIGWYMQLWASDQGAVGLFKTCASLTTCVSPSIYAFLGAAAVMSGITRTAISLVVILLELTGGLQYVFPVMVTVMCSKWIGGIFGSSGMVGEIIRANGYPFLHSEAVLNVGQVGDASDVMTSNPQVLTLFGETMQSIKTMLDTQPFHGYPIISDSNERVMVGYISQSDLLILFDEAEESAADMKTRIHFTRDQSPFNAMGDFLDFSERVDSYPVRILPDTPADRILDLFSGLGLRYCLVCNRRGTLLGIVKKKDLLHMTLDTEHLIT